MEEVRERQESIYKENSISELPVVRVSAFGAFLSGGTGNSKDDILLHKGQQTREVKEGEKVKVFLYHDPHHRLTASMRLPQISVGGIGYAPVMSTTRFGAFVDVGTERGIFLPFTEMIGRVEEGQQVWVKLYEDKTGRLAVTMHVDEEMRRIALPVTEQKMGDPLTGTVYNETGEGYFLITRDRHIAFIHKTEKQGTIRLGDEITGRISYIRSDGHVNIALRPQKEKAMEGDMALLVSCMERHNGLLPLTDKSDADLIKSTLGISKSAFKRAVGHLLKERRITIREGRIRLVK